MLKACPHVVHVNLLLAIPGLRGFAFFVVVVLGLFITVLLFAVVGGCSPLGEGVVFSLAWSSSMLICRGDGTFPSLGVGISMLVESSIGGALCHPPVAQEFSGWYSSVQDVDLQILVVIEIWLAIITTCRYFSEDCS